MRNASTTKRPRRSRRSCLQLMRSSATLINLPLHEGMVDSPIIVELDDAFLGLNHQYVQDMDGVDVNQIPAGSATVGTVGCD